MGETGPRRQDPRPHVPPLGRDDPDGALTVDRRQADAVVFDAAALLDGTGAGGARRVLRALRAAGVRVAVVQEGGNLPRRLAVAGLDELVTYAVDAAWLAATSGTAPSVTSLIAEALRALAVEGDRAVFVGRDARWLTAASSSGRHVVDVGAGAPGGRAAAGTELAPPPLGDVATFGRDALAGPPIARDDAWHLRFGGFDPADEARREVLCASGNGYLVSRGAAPESRAAGPHYPGTYVAGVYNRLVTEVDGRSLEHESLVNVPNWLPLTFRAAGGSAWFGDDGWETTDLEQWMELRAGILHRRARVRDPAGRVTLLHQHRLASMDDPHVLTLVTTLVPENWSGDAEVRSAVDGDVANTGVAGYRQLAHRHLSSPEIDVVDDETAVLTACTVQSRVRVAVALRTRCATPDALVARHTSRSAQRVDQHLVLRLHRGQPTTVEKVAAVYTSRDAAISDCTLAAAAAAQRAPGADELAGAHRMAWERQWDGTSILADVPGRTPAIVNLHQLHLLQSVSPHTGGLDAGITARGLHGEAYRGHVFWDELFVFRVLDFRFPGLTRSLLRYRQRRLGAARRLARETGCRGAMFPWQSGTTGREETPSAFFNPRSGRWMPDHSHLQRHVGLAVAFNVWSHYQVTGDVDFLVDLGAELMIEVARYWASVATPAERGDRYEIRGVMGPDEFHDGPPGAAGTGLVNNAYTNVMAAWVLWRAHQTVDLIAGYGGSRVCERLDLCPEELARWDDVGSRLTVPFDREGRIAQFAGYDELDELDWQTYRARYGDIGRLDLILEAEGDTPNRYKVGKQADVLMLFFMLSAEELAAVLGRLGYHFDTSSIPATIDYYLSRTSNGSTLSKVVHAWVLARSDRAAAWRLLGDALASDIDDVQRGTTGEGIHLGAMAGTIDLLQRCFVGLEARDDVLHMNPLLPDELPRLQFAIDYRGHHLDLDVSHRSITLRSRPAAIAPIRVAVRGRTFDVAGGELHTEKLRAR